MQIIQQITRDGKQWVDDNLARGCSDDSMVESMIASGVDPEVARQWLAIAKTPASSADRPTSAGQTLPGLGMYSYETLHTPTAGCMIEAHDHDVSVALRLAQSVVAIFDGVLSADECDELIRLSRIKLQRSTIVDPQAGVRTLIDDRNSDGTFFALNETAFIAQLDRRIAEVMHMPIENGEGLQILTYKVGGEYKTHFDYFPLQTLAALRTLQRGSSASARW